MKIRSAGPLLCSRGLLRGRDALTSRDREGADFQRSACANTHCPLYCHASEYLSQNAAAAMLAGVIDRGQLHDGRDGRGILDFDPNSRAFRIFPGRVEDRDDTLRKSTRTDSLNGFLAECERDHEATVLGTRRKKLPTCWAMFGNGQRVISTKRVRACGGRRSTSVSHRTCAPPAGTGSYLSAGTTVLGSGASGK